jgi:hypothetical protein
MLFNINIHAIRPNASFNFYLSAISDCYILTATTWVPRRHLRNVTQV